MYSVTVPARKMHSCPTTCVILCVWTTVVLDVNAVVLLQLVLLMQARPFALQVEPTMFLRDVSGLTPVSCGLSTAHVFGVFSSCLELNLLLKTFSPTWKFVFVFGTCPSGKLGICDYLWDRCLVYTSYRSARCCGRISIAPEDWLTQRLQAWQLMPQVG
jgi:hypothetical protein